MRTECLNHKYVYGSQHPVQRLVLKVAESKKLFYLAIFSFDNLEANGLLFVAIRITTQDSSQWQETLWCWYTYCGSRCKWFLKHQIFIKNLIVFLFSSLQIARRPSSLLDTPQWRVLWVLCNLDLRLFLNLTIILLDLQGYSIGARSQTARTYLENNMDKFKETDLKSLILHGLSALQKANQGDDE